MATADSPDASWQIESNTPLHGGLRLSKITKRNNHVPYNMRCCSPSSIHFWHLLGNVNLLGLIKFPNYSHFHAWYLLSILLMCGGSLHTLYFSSAPIDKNRKHPHIRTEKYQAWNWLYFGKWINPCKSGVFNPRPAFGPRASFVRPGKGISENTMRYEYWSLSH